MDDDELDGILDGALQEFQTVQQTTPPPKTATKNAVEQICAPKTEAHAINPTPTNDTSAPDLESALSALKQLGVEPMRDEKDVNEADMKLVEEFMSSLSTSLAGGGVAEAGSSARTGAAPQMEHFVESIVGELLSEDVLRAPMLQMRTAYAEWMATNESSLSTADRTRFKTQQKLVEEICEKYEKKAGTEEIMGLLSQMQQTGAPPEMVLSKLDGEGGRGEGMQAAELEKMGEMCEMQ